MTRRCAWVDASAGIAGDMLLGALVDAGAGLAAVRRAVDLVVPGCVELTARPTRRAGQRATKVEVEVRVEDPPHRTWGEIRSLLSEAALEPDVRSMALAVFSRLAAAEAVAHGVAVDAVHFHEVGALDSIADIVGVCAAHHELGIGRLTASAVALGTGHVTTAHGRMSVPVPAVVGLAEGWPVLGGGPGELTTPTGMALLAALAAPEPSLPPMRLRGVGVGAGTADPADHANVTRVLIGDGPAGDAAGAAGSAEESVCLEANVDDQDPRLWPGVLSRLMADGADDAWLVPILMKKGRPAHTLTVLCSAAVADHLTRQMLRLTTTIGVRRSTRGRSALPRVWFHVEVADHRPGAVGAVLVAVKVAHFDDGEIASVTPEFDDVTAAADTLGVPVQRLLTRALAAADAAGIRLGSSTSEVRLPARRAPVGRPIGEEP